MHEGQTAAEANVVTVQAVQLKNLLLCFCVYTQLNQALYELYSACVR